MKSISFLFLAAGIFIFSPHADACSSSADWSEEKAYRSAKEIFRAFVTKVQVRPNAGLSDVQKQWQLVDVYYELKEVLKGQPTEIGPISTHNAYFGGCGVPVVAGVDYLFFVEPFEADATIELKGNSSGFISNTSTQSLPASEVHAENIVSEARDMISRF